MSTSLKQLKWDEITAIRINDEWLEVSSIEPYELQVGSVREAKVQTCFWSDANLGVWIKVETPENHFYYYPVTEITGIEADGPSGG